MSPWRTRTIRTVAVVLAMALASSMAAAAPPNLQIALLSADQLSPDQRQRVQEYVEYWTGQLADPETPLAEAVEAADKLIGPCTSPGARSAFRVAYARAALPKLTAILEQRDHEYRAVQAAKVMGLLGTPNALEKLVDWCDPQREPRQPVRLWAARGCELLIQQTQQQNLVNEREVNGALRSLRQAAEDEQDWLVLHRLFQAMAAAGNEASRQRQLEAFDSVTRRMEQADTPSELTRAVTRALVSFRDQYINLAVGAEQRNFGKELGPMLDRVLQVASDHWEQVQQDALMKKVYGQAVQLSENLLKLIDPNVRLDARSPSTTLHAFWQQGDRPGFVNDVESWANVLRSPQYNGP